MKFLAEMFVPVLRRHSTFLPVVPPRIGLQRRPHLLGGKALPFSKIGKGTVHVHGNNDSANIENDGAGWLENWPAKNWHGYFRSEGVAATTSDDFAFPANLARNTLITGGSSESTITPAIT